MNKSQSKSNDQIIGIDIIRFLAAMLVLLYHSSYTGWAIKDSSLQKLTGESYSFPEIAQFSWWGWVGVEIFFVISGFVIAYSALKSTPINFAISRAVRLYPGAWICATISLLITLALVNHKNPIFIEQYIRSITISPFGPWIDGAYWTLGVEIAFYTSILIVIQIFGAKRLYHATAFIGLASVAFYAFLLGMLAHKDFQTVINLVTSTRIINLSLLGHGVFFALGALIQKSSHSKLNNAEKVLATLFTFFCIIEIYLTSAIKFHIELDNRNHVYGAIPALAWCLCIYLISKATRDNEIWGKYLSPSISRRVGLITYPLYLSHTTLVGVILFLAFQFDINKWIALITSAIVVLVISDALAQRIEHPLQNWLRIVLLKRFPSQTHPVQAQQNQ